MQTRISITFNISDVDENCLSTLEKIKAWVFVIFNLEVSKSTIDRSLKDFHYIEYIL